MTYASVLLLENVQCQVARPCTGFFDASSTRAVKAHGSTNARVCRVCASVPAVAPEAPTQSSPVFSQPQPVKTQSIGAYCPGQEGSSIVTSVVESSGAELRIATGTVYDEFH